MKIPVHESLKVARQVVNLIQLPKEIAKECRVESWSNCREQGLHIVRYGREGFSDPTVNIAQARSSDSIFVCWGQRSDFDNQTHQESEEVYKNQSRYFRYNEQEQASKFIARYLETGKLTYSHE